MKKALVLVLVVCFMAVGCATLQKFFCTPTSNQMTQAQTDLAAAQAAINSLSPIITSFPAAAAAVAALNLAVPVFNTVISGTCVAIADFQAAEAAINSASPVVAQAKKAKLIK